ncbi:MAG: hypothetical protein QOF25_1575, partial [Mycobacterium sp.]|nr:hypothetical protein [Mycobacterium sp.]
SAPVEAPVRPCHHRGRSSGFWHCGAHRPPSRRCRHSPSSPADTPRPPIHRLRAPRAAPGMPDPVPAAPPGARRRQSATQAVRPTSRRSPLGRSRVLPRPPQRTTAHAQSRRGRRGCSSASLSSMTAIIAAGTDKYGPTHVALRAADRLDRLVARRPPAFGCPPPGDSAGSGSSNSWPPTAVDWLPPQNSVSGDDAGGSADGGNPSTPIVMPSGQQAPPTTHSEPTSTSTPPKPIVPAGAPPTGTAPTAIVTPATSSP